ncbi:transglycosylase domain-containing protein [Catellatospora sp. KI3]|uniref:transglycosylase domain-containing protein n=1 Tax=Catellatospora sp. KI3 TaxID=3041620 RepID=UPI002483188E|nr:transglycosylase domain-containing protein [Catellatospora sp. KI3]MDI1462389.1 transglycosylase domain-containing protein [Catellatospora sp. KI3]
MSRKPLAKRLTKIAVVTVAVGAVLAVAATPAVALADWAIEQTAPSYESLPQVLREPATAQASYLYANDGKTVITTFYDQNRRDVPLDQVAPAMRDAVVAAEDTRFFTHHGVDVRGVLRAVVANGASGGVEQGASTLTMQYVRNVLKNDPGLTPEERESATEQTASRKIREARYALSLEQKLSKNEILERYLNIAYFGAGAYGVDAAAHTYFSKNAADLTLGEASLLAGLLQAPEADNPLTKGLDGAVARREYVLAAMVGTGSISRQQADAAQATAPVLKRGSSPNDCVASKNEWGFFCDYFRTWWKSQPAFGDTPEARVQALKLGGYRIVTTLDPAIATEAQRQAVKVYGYTSKRALPMAVVEPGTGRVLAMAVNRHYNPVDKPGNTVNQLIAGADTAHGYQAGSTFKMFTMLAALEQGKTLDTSFDSPSRLVTRWPDSGETTSCDGFWCPKNASPSFMDGRRNMWTGFGRSVNTYFVWLEEQVGADRAVEMAQRLGIQFRDSGDADRARSSAASWGSFTLGVSLTTPLDLANAYATLAADGKYCTPVPVRSVTTAAGAELDVARPDCRQVITDDVARAATDAARCPVGQQSAYHGCDGGTATAVSQLLGGRPVAGKTGSSTDNMTETFVAYTPQLAAAAIAANPDSPLDKVGAAVLPQVYRAVAATLATGSGPLEVKQFVAPTRTLVVADHRDRGDEPGLEPVPASPSPSAVPSPSPDEHSDDRSDGKKDHGKNEDKNEDKPSGGKDDKPKPAKPTPKPSAKPTAKPTPKPTPSAEPSPSDTENSPSPRPSRSRRH